MKKMYKLFSGFVAAVAIITLFSCQGPPGVAGTDGADGADGANGTDGTDGTSGNVTCMTCHNESTDYSIKRTQFNESAHALGTYYSRTGECSGCHSTEGFLARKEFSSASEIYDLAVPEQTAISCKTCHNVHQAYTLADYALTTSAVVTETIFGTKAGDENESYALGDLKESNLCLQCHQARDRGNVPTATSTDSVETSSHWGPHYGVQGNVLFSQGGVPVGTGYPTTPHKHGQIESACISCHMHNDNHSLAVNYDACITCHSSGNAEDKLTNLKTDIEELLMELGAALEAKGVMTEVTDELDAVIGYAPIDGMMSADNARLVYNYMVVEEDASFGMHNPTYIKKLLNNSIAELK